MIILSSSSQWFVLYAQDTGTIHVTQEVKLVEDIRDDQIHQEDTKLIVEDEQLEESKLIVEDEAYSLEEDNNNSNAELAVSIQDDVASSDIQRVDNQINQGDNKCYQLIDGAISFHNIQTTKVGDTLTLVGSQIDLVESITLTKDNSTYQAQLDGGRFVIPEILIDDLGDNTFDVIASSDCSQLVTSITIIGSDGDDACYELQSHSIVPEIEDESEVTVGTINLTGVVRPGKQIDIIMVELEDETIIQGAVVGDNWNIPNVPVDEGRNSYKIKFSNECDEAKSWYYLNGVKGGETGSGGNVCEPFEFRPIQLDTNSYKLGNVDITGDILVSVDRLVMSLPGGISREAIIDGQRFVFENVPLTNEGINQLYLQAFNGCSTFNEFIPVYGQSNRCRETTIVSATSDSIRVSCEGDANRYGIKVMRGDEVIHTEFEFRPSQSQSVSIPVPGVGEYTVMCKTWDARKDQCPSVIVNNTFECSTQVNTTLVEAGNGSFDISCSSNSIINTEYQVNVLQNGDLVEQLFNHIDGVYTYVTSNTDEGEFTFICEATSNQIDDNQSTCELTTGVVTQQDIKACTNIEVLPSTLIDTSTGDDFTIVCEGEGVQEWNVSYSNPNAGVFVNANPIAGTTNTFEIAQENLTLTDQDYTVTCIAVDSTTNTTPSACIDTIRVVSEPDPVCLDPISVFAIQSPASTTTTASDTQDITVAVDPETVDSLDWMVKADDENGDIVYSGRIENIGTQTQVVITVPLISNSTNYIWIQANPVDQLCSSLINDIIIINQGEEICESPVGVVEVEASGTQDTVDVKVVTSNTFRKRVTVKVVNNNQLISQSSDTVFGSTIVFDNLTVQSGTNSIRVEVTPLDDRGVQEENCETKTLITEYEVPIIPVCIDPITTFEIVSPAATTTTAQSTQSVTVSVDPTQVQSLEWMIKENDENGEILASGTESVTESTVLFDVPLVDNTTHYLRVQVNPTDQECNVLINDVTIIQETLQLCEESNIQSLGVVAVINDGVLNDQAIVPGSVVQTNSLLINGFVQPSQEYTYIVNLNGNVVEEGSTQGSFDTPVILQEGSNTVQVTATSTDGSQVCDTITKTLSFVYQPATNDVCEHPIGNVAITAPLNGQLVGDTSTDVTVTTSNIGPKIVALTVRDSEGNEISSTTRRTVDAIIVFSDVDLRAGENTIEAMVFATDSLLSDVDPDCLIKTAVSTMTVQQPPVCPVSDQFLDLQVDQQDDQTTTTQTTQTVSGTANPNTVREVRVSVTRDPNGTTTPTSEYTATVRTDGSWSVNTDLIPGSVNYIWIQAVPRNNECQIVGTDISVIQKNICEDTESVGVLTFNLNDGESITEGLSDFVVDVANNQNVSSVQITVNNQLFLAEESITTPGRYVINPSFVAGENIVLVQVTGKDQLCSVQQQLILNTVSVPVCEDPVESVRVNTTVTNRTATSIVQVANFQNDENDGTKTIVYTLTRSDNTVIDTQTVTTTRSEVEFTTPSLTTGEYFVTVTAQGVNTSDHDDNDSDDNDIGESSEICLTKTDQSTFTITGGGGGGNICEDEERVDISFENLPDNNRFDTDTYQFSGVVTGTGNLTSLTIDGQSVVVSADGSFDVRGVFGDEDSVTLEYVYVATDLQCNGSETITITRDSDNEDVCEEIRALEVIEGSTSVSNSTDTYEFNGSFLTTDLAQFTITQDGSLLSDDDIILGTVNGLDTTNFRTIVTLSEGRNEFVFSATSEESNAICNDSETVVITRNTRSSGGSSSGGGRSSSILCGNNRIDDRRGEQCDDGNRRSGDGCSSTCQIEEEPVCGNEIIEIGEMCDDGNSRNGDGCDAMCEIEDEEIKKEIIKENIRQVVASRRSIPIGYTPPTILPETGIRLGSGRHVRSLIQ